MMLWKSGRSNLARRSLRLTLLLCAAWALAACGGADDAAPPPADPPEKPTAPAEPAPPAPAPAPTEPAGGGTPAAPDAASAIAAGVQSYAIYCSSCHGATGDSNTPIADTIQPRPTRHDDGAYMGTLTDDHIFRVIKEGGAAVGKSPMMAPWGGSLSDQQIHELVAFIRTLPKS